MDKLGVQDFRSARLELFNIGIRGLINKAIKVKVKVKYIIPVLCT